MPFIDLHCDTISRLLNARRTGEAGSLRQADFHIDLEKLKGSDYILQNFALFVNLKGGRDPLQEVLTLADLYWEELANNKDLAQPVLSFADLAAARREQTLGCLLTVEEGGVCLGRLSLLRTLYRVGVRMLTLTWNYPNELGQPNGQPGGLTETGLAFLEEMERLGMIADVSHLGDDGFWDVVKYCDGPFVASHSNARAVCNHTRNMTDDMIRALADKGGVMGLNFCGDFLNPNGKSRVEDMVRHAKHIINVGGSDILGLGTDYDGIDGDLELDHCDKMPLLAQEMERQGFSTQQIEKIFHGNVLRLYREVLK